MLSCHYGLVVAAGVSGTIINGSRDNVSLLRERYTKDRPLIYEDSWSKSPYSFVDSEGEPAGFDVELVREVMRRINLPYEIRMRNQDTVHVDLRDKRADLSFGVSANYNAPYGLFGSVTISQFENSLLVPRQDSLPHVSFNDLRRMHLVVSKGSRAHVIMKEGGMPDSLLTAVDDIKMAVLNTISNGEGGVLWNTIMMKWLLRKYSIQNYVIVPTDIPAGEYRFMSHDRQLLHVLDSVALVMQQEGEIDRLTNRWIYPESDTKVPYFLYVLLALVGLLAFVVLIVQTLRYYRTYYSHSTLGDINSQMELILSSNEVRVWVYDVIAATYAWMTPRGTVEEEYNSFEFSRFYPDQDFYVIHTTVMELLKKPGVIETKTLRRYSDTDPNGIIDIEVSMQPITDDYGKVYLVCGVQNNITDSKAHIERMRLLHERYKTAFNIALGGILRFDADGYIIDANSTFYEWLHVSQPEQLLSQHINIRDINTKKEIDLESGFDHDLSFCYHANSPEDYAPFSGMGENFLYMHLIKNYDDKGKLAGYIEYVKEITEDVKFYRSIREKESRAMQLKAEGQLYRQQRDDILRASDIVLMRYYPEAKRLFFYDRTRQRMVPIPQLRVIQMIESRDMKSVFKAFYRADALDDREVHLIVGTLMRNSEGESIKMEVHMCPFKNENGIVLYYFGTGKDVTSQIKIQNRLMEETVKAREAEQVRQNFIRNISYSIRQPLVMIQKNLSSFKNDESAENEHALIDGVKISTQRLVTLSDDIFTLSRVEADMYTQELKVSDFVQVYKDAIERGLQPYRQSTVTYRIENLYDELHLYFDSTVVGRILSEAVALSARYTHFGVISVRYMYRKNRLTVAIEDNGQGIPPHILDNIFEPHVSATYQTTSDGPMLSGLEMPICHAFIKMLGGSIDVESRTGHGTVIYIDLPLSEK